MSTTRLLVVHARSPLHAGTGQSTAAVDLPIARDRATDLPLIPGSSIKGALRARARTEMPKEYTTLFGPETDKASDHAGVIAISDARLLLLPVRSVAGTFAWVTSPYLLASVAREAKLAKIDLAVPPAASADESWCSITSGSLLKIEIDKKPKVVLEEFDLHLKPDADKVADDLAKIVFPGDIAWQDLLKKRLCIVHDDVMSFLARHATEIVTRVSINPETGTAKDGQLWTEENLPAESVLMGLVEEVPAEGKRIEPGAYLERFKSLIQTPIQLGGKATVGRGRCQLGLHGGK